MSLNGMVDLALSREKGAPTRQGNFVAAGESPADTGSTATQLSHVGSVLTAAIPGEVLALYTAFVSATASRFTPTADRLAGVKKAQLGDLALLRWLVFGAVLIGMIGFIYSGWRGATTRRRRFPVAELLAPVIAFSAWALAMPAGLAGLFVETRDLSVVSLAVATAAAALLLGLSAPLRKQAKVALAAVDEPPRPVHQEVVRPKKG